MDITELNEQERSVLFGLAAHVVLADGRVDPAAKAELQARAEELGLVLQDALQQATVDYASLDHAIDAVRTVSRSDAREWIRTVLVDLATADGDRGSAENELLSRITLSWSRTPTED